MTSRVSLNLYIIYGNGKKPFTKYLNANASGNKEIFVNKSSYQISRIFLSDYILRNGFYVHT